MNNRWKLTTETDPIVIGALGLVNTEVNKYTSSIPGNIHRVQKILLAQ